MEKKTKEAFGVEKELPIRKLDKLEFKEKEFTDQIAVLREQVVRSSEVSDQLKELFETAEFRPLVWRKEEIGKFLSVLDVDVDDEEHQIEPTQIKELIRALNGRATPNLTLLNNSDEFRCHDRITVFFDQFPYLAMGIDLRENGGLSTQIERRLRAEEQGAPISLARKSTVDKILGAPFTKVFNIDVKPLFPGGKKESEINLLATEMLARSWRDKMRRRLYDPILKMLIETAIEKE